MSVAPTRNFTRVAVAIVIAALVISASALSYSSLEATVTKTASTGTGTTSISTSTVTTTSTLVSTKTVTTNGTASTSSVASSDYWSEQPYMNASALYAALGYPKVTYDDYSTPYLSSDPTFVAGSSASTSSQVGTSYAQVTSFSDAVQLAAAFEKLNPSNYTLGEAVFVPGTVSNGTVTSYPQWFLYFAQVTDGYWLLGDQGPYSLSIQVTVDALNGTALGAQGSTATIANPGQYDLAVNSSTALELVRTSSLPNVPADLTQNGTVTFMEPRVVVPGQYATADWIDPDLSGQSTLLWIINLSESNGEGALLGQFAVDAGTGSLVAGSSEQGYAP